MKWCKFIAFDVWFIKYFQVMFLDLAFIRFVVVDANTSHVISQRIIPLKCLRAGL